MGQQLYSPIKIGIKNLGDRENIKVYLINSDDQILNDITKNVRADFSIAFSRTLTCDLTLFTGEVFKNIKLIIL